MLDLNNPDTRESVLLERLSSGSSLVAAALAEELGLSVHTIRRDLISLEQKGVVRRVRGGAIPVSKPSPSYLVRAEHDLEDVTALAERAVGSVPERGTIFMDAGTTMDAVARRLPLGFEGLVVTPAPSVALLALERGARVHLIGGALCASGAMAAGGEAERSVATIAADVCFLGACGLWPDFGLSAEDAGEAGIKRAMALSANSSVVVASASKFERRGRHKVLESGEIHVIVTDAPPERTDPFSSAGVEFVHV
ncbi:MAG: DeoR/GlpR family DNA-binding transcription regulator [Pseudomonadota bacterium]